MPPQRQRRDRPKLTEAVLPHECRLRDTVHNTQQAYRWKLSEASPKPIIITPAGDGRFESVSLQRRVKCEPDFRGGRRGQFGSEPLVPLENALELADVVPKDCLACTALYRNGGGSNSQRNLLKPKIVISHLGGSDHRSEGRNEETRNGRGCGRKTSSSATVSCIFGFPRMSHWKRGRRCVAAERIPGVRGVTEHDVIEFQPRRPSPRVRNGREAPRLQTFQAPPERGGSTVRSRPRPHAS
jgi:hypothetical protein